MSDEIKKGLNPNFELKILPSSEVPDDYPNAFISAEKSHQVSKNEGQKEAQAKYKEQLEQAEQKNKQLEKQAFTDLMTDLPNRNAWVETVKHLDPNRGDGGTIIILDVNGLKEINDSQGHSQGDLLIKNTANIIKETFKRSQDQIFSFQEEPAQTETARIGGDEFLIYIPKLDTPEKQKNFEKFVDNMFSPENQKKNGTNFAYGIAHFDSNLDTEGIDIIDREKGVVYKTTFDRADSAMYTMKAQQKSQQNFSL